MLTRRLPASQRTLSAVSSRAILRLKPIRQARFATEASAPPPAPPPKRGGTTRILLYTSLFGAVFYTGGTFVALNNERYRDFFIESVPLGEAIIDYVEENGWDQSTLGKVGQKTWSATSTVYRTVEGAVSRTMGTPSSSSSTQSKENDGIAAAAVSFEKEGAEQLDKASEKINELVHEVIPKASEQVSEVTNDLIKKAEKAIPEIHVNVDEPKGGVQDVLATRDAANFEPVSESPTPAVQSQDAQSDEKIYTQPLPLEFQPPPGYTLPKEKTVASGPRALNPHPPIEAPPAPEPLPLVAPAVSELAATEPVIAQLASTIDNLASFLQNNPNAGSAREVLEAAQADLVHFNERLEKVKEEERKKLEEKLEEQAREYSTALLEQELSAQDKVDQQEEGWRNLFEEERQRVVKAYREKLERELATQSEIINERLKEEVIAQGIEMQRRWIREVKVRVEQERGGRLAKLEELSTDLKKLERVTLDNSSYLDENIRVHTLWSAIRALTSVIDSPTRKPFREELRVLRHIAAARDDPVISAALDSLEKSSTPDVGVEPLADLVSWFSTSVSPRVESVALVPDENAGVLSHLASSVFSMFRFKPQGYVEGNDVLSVLARAESYMNEKNLDAAARALNQLHGWPKKLLVDWLAATRSRLEVQQAIEIIQTQATVASLLVI